jgi:DNA repair exonuclease SbcCD ATPase subunit
VTDFRGVLGSRTYRFDESSALICGDNGVGKSTLALALEWTLFGGFPSNALGKPRDVFMSPVGGGDKPKGEVVFARDGERVVVRRDGAENELVVELGREETHGDEAKASLEQALGVDADTFVRAVLLQQCKIRGLLLDEPRERNKALDRLLGMEDAEVILDLAKAKPFKEAAEAWRRHIRATERRFESQQELLAEQYSKAEREARELKFLDKDLSARGLEAQYAKLQQDLAEMGERCGVELAETPAADSVQGARKTSRAVDRAIRQIRMAAEPQQKLVPVQRRLAALVGARDRWNEVTAKRDGARTTLETAVKAGGDAKARAQARATAEADVKNAEVELRIAGELSSLLNQAREYLTNRAFEACPVCEQGIAEPDRFIRKLGQRTDALTTKSILSAKSRLEKARSAHQNARTACGEVESLQDALAEAEAEVESERKAAMALLETEGLVEKKVAAALRKTIASSEKEHEILSNGVKTIEAELESFAERDRTILEGLVPFVSAREAVAAHERAWAEAKLSFAGQEAKAAEMDAIATDIDAIRKALLAAKDEIASETLEKARPRAQALYAKLVQHKLFDQFEVKTARKANKVDYSFEVASSSLTKSGREARLVLSDGQLTAAALALFYALAESSRHHLDLLFIDDPTQNLDHTRRLAMAKTVVDLASRKQVVVSTQDEDFVTLLRDAGFDRSCVVHHITAWNRTPEVETTMPGGA